MDRAEGTSSWIVNGEFEINAEDTVRVDGDAAVWAMEAIGTGDVAVVKVTNPAARRFVETVLREKARIAQRHLPPRPVPKPASSGRRKKEQQPPVPCPQCEATGPLDCSVCGGDGYVPRQD